MEHKTYVYGQPINDWREAALNLAQLNPKPKDPSLQERVEAIETQIKKPK